MPRIAAAPSNAAPGITASSIAATPPEPDCEVTVAGVVEPRLSRGLRDLFPDAVGAARGLIDTIRGVYERYGFVPLATPAIEHLDVLLGSGGQEANASIFRVQGPEEDEKLGLRFDLTVPLARVFSQYIDLPRPFRRYQVGSVWRADNPGRGRFREFTQFDIDAVGVESEIADVEIIAALCDALTALQVGPFRVRLSSRRVLNLLLTYAGIAPERGGDVFRVLDKLDKLGIEKVKLELTTGYKDESGSPIPGLGLRDEQVRKIEDYLNVRPPRREDALTTVRAMFASVAEAEREITGLARVSQVLASLGYGDDVVAIDLSIARGLAYYDGPVFEAHLLDAPQFGTVAAGGRYDNLVTRFSGERVPAVGGSIGVDRLLAALTELGRVRSRKSTAHVLVTAIDPTLMDEYVAMTFELRRAGVNAELYLGAEKRFGKQVRYGDHYEVPIVVVCGGDEKARGTVQLKDMFAGKQRAAEVADRSQWRQERPGQFEVPRGELVQRVKQLLAEMGEGSGAS